jgi:hypothetical protein
MHAFTVLEESSSGSCADFDSSLKFRKKERTNQTLSIRLWRFDVSDKQIPFMHADRGASSRKEIVLPHTGSRLVTTGPSQTRFHMPCSTRLIRLRNLLNACGSCLFSSWRLPLFHEFSTAFFLNVPIDMPWTSLVAANWKSPQPTSPTSSLYLLFRRCGYFACRHSLAYAWIRLNFLCRIVPFQLLYTLMSMVLSV